MRPIALLVVTHQMIPRTEQNWERTEDYNWKYFLRMEGEAGHQAPKGLKHAQEALRIGEGAWQIPLDSGLPTLSGLIEWCRMNKVTYRVHYFESDPEWIESGVSE